MPAHGLANSEESVHAKPIHVPAGTFLQNHREIIAAMDFFTVPTVTFRVLYCFFVIEHHRRKILHYNVTPHPTAEWIVQQLREAFPECPDRRYR